MAQEDVLIKFEVDYTELDAAIATLEKTGKLDPKTAAQFSQTSKAISSVNADSAELIKTFKDVAGASVKMGKTVEAAFGAGVQDALDEAGVSVDEFGAALKKANAPAVSLKKELLQLKEQMARLKAAGKDTGTEFDTLRKKAGALSDAIADTNAEIKNAGSDTRGLDNVLGSVTALAGGYSAIQGATALFGEENEDLQKALLKVNGAMAIAQGLQVVYNATLKEGALTKLADSIATGAQTAAQEIYAVAVGASTGAMKAFRIALLGLGIGAIIAVIVLAAEAMGLFGSNTKSTVGSTEDLNKQLEIQEELFRKINERLAFNAKLNAEKLREQGVSQAAINKGQVQTQLDQIDAAVNERDTIQKQIDANKAQLAKIKQDLTKTVGQGATRAGVLQLLADQKLLKEQQEILKKSLATKQENVIKADQDLRILQAKQDADAAEAKRAADEKFRKAQEKAIEDARNKELAAIKEVVLANLKADADKEEQLRIHFENEQEIIERDRAAKEAINKKWDDLRLQMQKDLIKSSEQAANDAAANDKRIQAEKEAQAEKNKQAIIMIARQVADIYVQIADAQTKRDEQLIRSQRNRLDEELKAGVITQKAFDARQKQIDEIERRAKQKAAQREKTAAVFTALLAIPVAYLNGLKTSIPVAVISAALAAAQAALVIARPIPQFFRGKKDTYAGPGIVGDMGSELVERNGRMFLYTKPTQTYLGANDKVYTAAETRQIMHNTNINTTVVKDRPERFDYDRFAKAIPSAGININIDKDGISEWGAAKQNRQTYLARKWRIKQ